MIKTSTAQRGTLFASLLFAGAAFSGQASATMVASYETTSAGTTGAGLTTTLSVPTGTIYGNSFSGGADGGTLIPSTSYGFYDDYFFQITGATANSITSTLSLGGAAGLQITGLQARLFAYSGSGPAPTGSVSPSPIVSWSTAFSGGEFAVIPDTVLAPDRYVLQIRGTATGASGGSYSGVLNIAPVPLPAALPLLLGALGLLGGAGLKRRAGVVAA